MMELIICPAASFGHSGEDQVNGITTAGMSVSWMVMPDPSGATPSGAVLRIKTILHGNLIIQINGHLS